MLVGSLASGASVNEITGLNAERYSLIDKAFPANAATGEAVRMFVVEEGFCFSVTGLLFEVFSRRGAAVVPDEGGSGEAQGEIGIAKAPAEIDVVSGCSEDGVEAADF